MKNNREAWGKNPTLQHNYVSYKQHTNNLLCEALVTVNNKIHVHIFLYLREKLDKKNGLANRTINAHPKLQVGQYLNWWHPFTKSSFWHIILFLFFFYLFFLILPRSRKRGFSEKTLCVAGCCYRSLVRRTARSAPLRACNESLKEDWIKKFGLEELYIQFSPWHQFSGGTHLNMRKGGRWSRMLFFGSSQGFFSSIQFANGQLIVMLLAWSKNLNEFARYTNSLRSVVGHSLTMISLELGVGMPEKLSWANWELQRSFRRCRWRHWCAPAALGKLPNSVAARAHTRQQTWSRQYWLVLSRDIVKDQAKKLRIYIIDICGENHHVLVTPPSLQSQKLPSQHTDRLDPQWSPLVNGLRNKRL